MGRVSLAERDGEEAPVVVKRMNAELAADARFRRRLLREAEVAASLEHPNVVRVLDTGVIDDQLYLTMEYVPGSSLAGVLAASRPELLPLAPVLHAVAQACDGLAYVHRFAEPRTGKWMELVHRDISLDNLLVSYSGEVKVADFGIVKTVDGTQTTSGVIMGKLGYMSPEQLRDETLDASSDLYSLGVCLFELLACRRPLPVQRGRAVMEAVLYDVPPPLEQFRPDVPPSIAALVARMLSKDRKVRPTSTEVAKELRAVLAQRPEPTLFPSKLLDAPPRNRARPAPAEQATEVASAPPTRPQRLLGPAPAQDVRPVRRPTPAPAPAGRKLTPMHGVDASKETLALAPAERRPTPAPAPSAPTRGPAHQEHPRASLPTSPPDSGAPRYEHSLSALPTSPPTSESPHYEHSLSALPTSPPTSETESPEGSLSALPTRAPTPKRADSHSGMPASRPVPSRSELPAHEPAPEPEHSVYSVPTRAPTPKPSRSELPAPEPEHSLSSVPTRAPTPKPSRSELPAHEPDARPEHSLSSVPTRAPTPKPGHAPASAPDAAVAAESTRLLASAPSRRRLRKRWAALGGLALLGAAACWWWA
ncbi:protein kinase [Pyxidicoccus fallax]|uniref:Protein kinase n=2 Tax=Pyxidicoccus fallax TaxID=394095 RepID=A0A848LAP5_9BACT|nr:protein kinase [Pyxidicoccus fallax]NPC80586.1 protein kinase [Pyxidicoccus fallax]